MKESWTEVISSLESLPKGQAEKIFEFSRGEWSPTLRERWNFFDHTRRYLSHKYGEFRVLNSERQILCLLGDDSQKGLPINSWKQWYRDLDYHQAAKRPPPLGH